MKRRTCLMGAVVLSAGAGVAVGQGTMTFSWTVGDTGNNDGIIEPNESAIFTLWAMMDPMAVGFAGSIYDINGDINYMTRGVITDRTNLVDSVGSGPGDLQADNSITGIESFQFPPLFNPNFDASDPIPIYRMLWTPAPWDYFSVTFWSENHLNASVYTDTFGTSVEYDIVTVPASFDILPGPGVLAMFGVAGAGALRRRRAR